jgi:acyl-CoA reductase-like NAD-dependent aldehyde dehydrogenase
MLIHQNFLGGKFIPSHSHIEIRSPSDTEDIVGCYAQGDASDLDDAVREAELAFPAWRGASIQFRSDVLHLAGEIILRRRDEIAELLAREEGKILVEARAEVERAGRIFRFFAAECLRSSGQLVDSVRLGVTVEITREPLGVVGLITPWNFPIAIPAWKAAPALAYGNCVVLKPAELTPACAWVLAQVLQEAGCPPGVFNLVMGSGPVVGEAMLSNSGIAAVSFTGSERTGRRIAQRCSETLKKVQLEMGGKNPTVIMEDADIDRSVTVCTNSAFYSTGQRCTATSRFLVVDRIHDEFVDRLTKATRELRVGHALSADSQIGPVVSESQLKSNLAFVDLARDEGAEVVGGGRIESGSAGYYQAPALFLGATNAMRISREEIFGPCASVIKVADFDEALSVANDTAYGLSAGICTESLRYANMFKRLVKAGMVMVNLPTAGVDFHVPFGGRRASSYGSREQGSHAIEFFTVVKTSYQSV